MNWVSVSIDPPTLCDSVILTSLLSTFAAFGLPAASPTSVVTLNEGYNRNWADAIVRSQATIIHDFHNSGFLKDPQLTQRSAVVPKDRKGNWGGGKSPPHRHAIPFT